MIGLVVVMYRAHCRVYNAGSASAVGFPFSRVSRLLGASIFSAIEGPNPVLGGLLCCTVGHQGECVTQAFPGEEWLGTLPPPASHTFVTGW